MKLIESSVQIIEEKDPYKMIELAGRTCYRSENNITEDSAKEFVDRMIKLRHGAMLEHGTIYLTIAKTAMNIGDPIFYVRNKYSEYLALHRSLKDNEITFIMPSWWNYNSSIIESGERYFCEILQKCEDYYKSLLDMGYKPQEARVVLPNATKTELVMTGFESDWENFFELRCSKAAHPDAQKLANELKELLINVKKY